MQTNIISTQRHKYKAKYLIYYKFLHVIRILFNNVDSEENQEPTITIYNMLDMKSFYDSLHNLKDYDILNNEEG